VRYYRGSKGGLAVIGVFDKNRNCECVSKENGCCGLNSKKVLPRLFYFTKPIDTA